MSEPFATSDAIARAKEWLEAASSKWRLQTLQYRSRYDLKTGTYKKLPTRVRRFLNGTPSGMKAAVLAVLKDSAPYKSPVFDLERDGLEYLPTNTFIRKDGMEHSTNGKDATYTIIQDLRLADGVLDRFQFADESSCASVGESEYRWDEPDVEPCPDGSQGVSYQVSNVSRDRETDLFSYQVRKVQALTQHQSPVVTQCDSAKRVTVEAWNNVYGEPGAFRFDPVKGGSAPVDLPGPCSQPDGTSVQVNVSENADCTYRVEVVKTEARTLEGQFSIYRDQYKVQETERTANAFAPLGRTGVEYSNGVTKRFTSEPNADGTWNNSVETETERAVRSSSVEVRVMPRHTVRTRIDTNVPEAADAVPGGGYGSYKSTKTQGGLFVNEYVQYLRTHLGDLGLVCTDTAFLKTHETQETADSVPAGSHVPVAANGLVTTWNYDTDAEGVVVKRVRTESEHEVRDAVRRRTWGYLGTTSGYTHRSVAKSVMESLMASQEKGTSVEARMTNGALWDVEVQTFLRITGQSLGLDCQKTVYQHVHEVAVSAASMGGEASEAGGGRTYRRSFRLDTATGAITRTDTTTTELEVPESRRVVRVTARGKTVRTTKSNTPSKPSDASKPGETTEFEVTPGGRYNVTTEKTVPKAGDMAKECSSDVFQETDATVQTQASASPDHVPAAGGGTYRERVQRLGDDGLWEVKDTEVVERPDVDDGVDVSVTARGKRKTVKTRQKASKPSEPGVNDAGKSLRTQRTRGGLWNVEETTVEPRAGANGKDCSKDLFQHTSGTTELKKDAAGDHVEETSDMSGVYRERRQRLGDDGLWEVVDVEHQEKAVTRQREEVRVTRAGKIKRTTDLQVTIEGTEPQARVADIGKERVVEKTRGGRRNVTKVEVEPLTEQTEERCEIDAFLHTDVKVRGVRQKGQAHAEAAGGGRYHEVSYRMNELGVWEETKADHEETAQAWTERDYQDAFGSTKVFEDMANASQAGGRGGAAFDVENLIRHVEAQMTKGLKYNVRTVEERPRAVSSGHLSFERSEDKGPVTYYDFIVFRNQKIGFVRGEISWIQKRVSHQNWNGSFSFQPHISISPNKFGLWDGSIALTTVFTPKAWAAGGSKEEDNLDENEYTVKDVQVSPMNSATSTTGLYLLKATTTETHLRGGGVGKDKLHDKLSRTMIRGSQFSYHPSGQSFQYDIITSKTVTYQIVKCNADKFDVKPDDGVQGG